jgi:hypothetical protein
MHELATALEAVGQTATTAASDMQNAAQQSRDSWSGVSADRFVERMSDRAQVIGAIGEVAGQAAPVLSAYAASITTAQEAYSVAAYEEQFLRPYLPASLAAVELAMAAQVAAITQLHVAGTAFATALSALTLKAEAADTFGIVRNPYEVIRDGINGIIEAWNEDDIDSSIIRELNETRTVDNADGSVTQLNLFGMQLELGPLSGVLRAAEVITSVRGHSPGQQRTRQAHRRRVRYPRQQRTKHRQQPCAHRRDATSPR